LDGQTFMVWARPEPLVNQLIASGVSTWKPVHLTIPLLGSHQVENAATAYAALRTADQAGLTLSKPAIQAGFSQVRWLARFEILRRQPPVVVDSAHNRDSALKLRLAIEEYFPGYPGILVFGASEDKDVRGMLTELLPVVGQVVAVKSFHPRAMDPDVVVDLAKEMGRPAKAIPEVVEGVQAALDLAGEAALVLVTGSIFVAAGARSAWEKGLLHL
jgi:dihydrofolate synthase/folylpolyglutamate synthase